MSFIWVFLGGGSGALLRFSISRFFMARSVPIGWSTLAVNLVGCLLYFCLVKWGKQAWWEEEFFKIGFLGSLTTFSTFAYEVWSLLQSGQIWQALGLLLLNIVLGIGIGFVVLG